MISVVLIEPGKSGNVGAIARAMKNFCFNELVLVNPKCNHLSQTSRNRAKHANDVLKKAKIRKLQYLKKFDSSIKLQKIEGDILKREREISTGLGNGLALPHTKTKGVNNFYIVVGLNKDGVDFDSMDGLPSKIFL